MKRIVKYLYALILLLTVISIQMISGCSRSQKDGDGVQLLYWPSTNPYEIKLGRDFDI